MKEFYSNLEQIEEMLDNIFSIVQLGNGHISVNGVVIDTKQQLEMLTPDFFNTMSSGNHTITAYKNFFQKMGILPTDTPHIPLIRNIPLRSRTHHENNEQQQQAFAMFLKEHIFVNQWHHLFSRTYEHLKIKLAQFYQGKNRLHAATFKKIKHDLGDNTSHSGSYYITQQVIEGHRLNLYMPDDDEELNIQVAIDKSLNDTRNRQVIIERLIPTFLSTRQIAFHVRGIRQNLLSKEEIENAQFDNSRPIFFLLDRNTKRLYCISNPDTRNNHLNMLFFKAQLDIFLKTMGDHRTYNLHIISAKSMQSDEVLHEACSVSQFLNYIAILSGVGVNELQDKIPTKISTLLYLLQLATTYQHAGLFNMLDTLMEALTKAPQPLAPLEIELPSVPQLPNNTPYFSWLLKALMSFGQALFTLAAIAIVKIVEFSSFIASHTNHYIGRFFEGFNPQTDYDRTFERYLNTTSSELPNANPTI